MLGEMDGIHVPFPPDRRSIMAGANLCVSCASLPMKDRAAAIALKQCPECKTPFGVTSYGAAFRLEPAKRKMLTPTFFTGMMIGIALFMFVIALTGLSFLTKENGIRP